MTDIFFAAPELYQLDPNPIHEKLAAAADRSDDWLAGWLTGSETNSGQKIDVRASFCGNK